MLAVKTYLQKLEELLRTQVFLAGEEQGAADLLIWPWLERLGALKLKTPSECGIRTVPVTFVQFIVRNFTL